MNTTKEHYKLLASYRRAIPYIAFRVAENVTETTDAARFKQDRLFLRAFALCTALSVTASAVCLVEAMESRKIVDDGNDMAMGLTETYGNIIRGGTKEFTVLSDKPRDGDQCVQYKVYSLEDVGVGGYEKRPNAKAVSEFSIPRGCVPKP